MSENDPETTAEGESFVGRWARLKREGEAEASAPSASADEVPRADAEEDAPAAALAAEPEQPEPVKTDADMPPIESIDEHSNIGDFFSSGVSRELRQAALRRLFHLPKYNFRDGLNDYDADYRNFVPLGDVVTSDMRLKKERLEEMARRARDRLEASNDDPATAQAADGDEPEAAEPGGNPESGVAEKTADSGPPRPDGHA